MSKKTSYTDEQMIHTLNNNGESQRAIADALEIPRTTVQEVLKREPRPLEYAEIVGDGCSYMTEGGSIHQDEELLTPLDIEELDLSVSNHPTGQLTGIESGYPDIYYNERSNQYDVYLHGRRIWRDTKLTKACEVRLAKGHLSKADEELLQAVIGASPEVQEALNYPPI